MITAFAIAAVLLAAVPAALFLKNRPVFQAVSKSRGDTQAAASPASRVSVLIPARDEATGIAASVHAALHTRGVDVEVIVLDDHSTDETAEIVNTIAQSNDRVRLIAGAPLPPGWNGKQHACWQLAAVAGADHLMFLDADVRLHPDAIARLIAYQHRHAVALLSAFPHQRTETLLEKWIIPLMHYILLGFLPLSRMRNSTQPGYAAGCGQLFLTSADDYQRSGTHAAIRSSRHDGLKLPRLYRTAGLTTDVVDGTQLAECRMYGSGREVIRGVLKNATEGMANPRLIVIFTVLLLGGSVLPVVTLFCSLTQTHWLGIGLSVAGVVLGHLPRALAARHFRQPISGVVFHSVATTLFVALQWLALMQWLVGKQVAWRGRSV